MHGICGWVGDLVDMDGSHRLLAGMLRDCGAQSGIETPGLRENALHFGHLGNAADVANHLYTDDAFAIVVSEGVCRASGRTLSARDLTDLYRAHGLDFLRRVRGSFSLALYDRRERTLVLAVDRIGQQPLYVHRNGGQVAFASRLDALRRLPGFQARLDHQAIFDYLYFHAVPSPGTIYSGCDKLLPAQMAVVGADGRCRKHLYWNMPYREDSPAGFDALRSEFLELLPRAVARATGNEHTIGAFLGADNASATVAGILAQLRGEPVPTYSIGYVDTNLEEIEYAHAAAKHFGTEARACYVTPQDVFESIPAVAAYCDEPFGSASAVPAYLCARYAREEGIEQLLSGGGGKEIFGGHTHYAIQETYERYDQIPDFLRNLILAPLALHFPRGERLSPVRKFKGYIQAAKIPLPDRLEIDNLLHHTSLDEVFEPDFLAQIDPEHPLAALREAYGHAEAATSLNCMMHMDLKITLADKDLRTMHQACALAGIEVRYPLLDYDMMVFAASVPPHMQVRHAKRYWFMRQALSDLLPRRMIDKPRHGPVLPMSLWIAEFEPLKELCETSLVSLGRRGIVNSSYLNGLVKQRDDASSAGMLWSMLMLEQWLQQHGH